MRFAARHCTFVAVVLVGSAGLVAQDVPAETTPTFSPLVPNDPPLAAALQLWLKADGLRLADGERVHVWPDASGHGRDLTATLGVRTDGTGRPAMFVASGNVCRRPAVRFAPDSGLAASPDNRVQISGDSPFTIVLVMNLRPNEGEPPFDGILGVGNPAHAGDPGRPLAALVQINRNEDHALHLAGGWNHDASLGPGSFKSLYERAIVLTIVKTPGAIKDTTRFFVNGEPSTGPPLGRSVTGRDTLPDIQHRPDIGAYMGKATGWAGSFRGDVSEAIVYNAALPDDQRAGLELHLFDKYAVTPPSLVRATRAAFTPQQKSHWSFQPVRDPAPPTVRDEAWIKSPLDRFVLAKLEQQGLRPAPPADKRTLIRRVTFDLIGLPPTPDEVEAFVNDGSPDAFAKVVNRLLDSPHYGEHWGRHWLDVVRYADTTANDANAVMRFAYRYRDYVVDAFNRDLPYDQFIVEQLAGDLLPSPSAGEGPGLRGSGGTANSPSPQPPTPRGEGADFSAYIRRIIATGFLMLGPKALAETDKEQTRLDIVDEQIDVTGRALLGLTLACARCHDHKFDPIPTVDYYGMAGIFRSTEPLKDENRNATMWQEFPLFQIPGEKPFVVMAAKEALPRNLRVHQRGNRFNLGQLAPRRFPQIVAGEQSAVETTQSGRLELARWIASRDNPLTARVMVNRIWQGHFGAGLVATSDNFGTRGEPPSHPELLDWLASRFVESGWSVKAVHRLILLASTYQQSCTSNPQAAQLDANDRLLWQMSRRRLDAESLRDAVLAASGRLDRTVGGGDAAEILYKVAEVLDGERGFAPNRMTSDHPFYSTSLRRSLYLPVVRNMQPDSMALFDAADPNSVCTMRNETTVAPQALFMLNNSVMRDQSLQLAKRLLADEKLADDERVRRAYALVLGRPPSEDEIREAASFLSQYLAATAAQARPESERRAAAWQSYCQMLLCLNEFLYVE